MCNNLKTKYERTNQYSVVFQNEGIRNNIEKKFGDLLDT